MICLQLCEGSIEPLAALYSVSAVCDTGAACTAEGAHVKAGPR